MGAPEKLLAIALGGHATLPPGANDKKIETQNRQMRAALERVLAVTTQAAEAGYNFQLFTHGSGPQTGIEMDRAFHSEQAGMHRLPLDEATANLIGSLGMAFEEIIRQISAEEGLPYWDLLGRNVRYVGVVPTSVLVEEDNEPTKAIGSPITDEAIIKRKRDEGVTLKQDEHGFRVMVPSPRVVKVFDSSLAHIETLIRSGFLAIAGGTGGKAFRWEDGRLSPQEVVVDKDRTCRAIIAGLNKKGIQTDTFAILTAVPCVVKDFARVLEAADKEYGGYGGLAFGEKTQVFAEGDPVHRTTASKLMQHLVAHADSDLVSGGMGPKISAACTAVSTGAAKRAIICAPDNFAEALLEGTSGTIITQ